MVQIPILGSNGSQIRSIQIDLQAPKVTQLEGESLFHVLNQLLSPFASAKRIENFLRIAKHILLKWMWVKGSQGIELGPFWTRE